MEEQLLLGMPLKKALERLSAAGINDPEVEFTRAPRGGSSEGTPRVIRALEGGARLTAARFPDRVGEDA